MSLAELDSDHHEHVVARFYEELRRRYITPCKQCGGTGRVIVDIDDNLDTKSEHCACKKRVLFEVALLEAGIPKELHRADEIEPDNNVKHFKTMHAYAQNIDGITKERGLSVFMHGENGTGKTSSACVAAIAALRRNMSVALVHWPDVIRSMLDDTYNRPHHHLLTKRLERDLLIVDEVGKETTPSSRTDFPIMRLEVLVKSRRENLKPTILITNLTLTKFKSQYGESILSQLAPPYRVLAYKPGDHRRKQADAWEELLR